MGNLAKAMDLANNFKKELERASELGADSFILLQPDWIMGTVLLIGVSSPESWIPLISSINRMMQVSDMIRGASTEKAAIFFNMAVNGWAYTRQDRGQGSPVLSVWNGMNADSPSTPQTIKVVPAGKMNPLYNFAVTSQRNSHEDTQLVAHFLRLSLRLCAADIGTSLELLSLNWLKSKRKRSILQGKSPEEQSMLRSASAALSFAQDNGFLSRNHFRKMLRPYTLVKLSEKYNISAADRYFDNCWAIMVTLEGISAVEALRKRTPSFFMQWADIPNCKPQVHLTETPVSGHRNCVLLAFWKEPGRDEIEQVLRQLRPALHIKPKVSMLATYPFEKTDGESWIRPDGRLDLYFHDQTLCRQLRRVIARNMKTGPGKASNVSTLADNFPVDRPPQRFVVFARQGKEDNAARLTIPHQLTTILFSEFFSMPNPIFRPDTDKLHIVEEICSSNQHPWRDRRALKDIPRDLPLVFLTTNPDRLTSRADEVDRAICTSSGNIWFTQGVRGSGEVGDWHEVKGDIKEMVEAQLLLSRQRHLETGTYSRGDAAATNTSNYLTKTEGPTPDQVQALQKAIHHMIKAHGFKRILVFVRTSPSSKPTDKECTNSSIERQIEFLGHMLGECSISIHWEKAVGVSASKCHAVDRMEECLEGLGEKTLVLTARVDRMTRSVSEFDRVQMIIAAGGHGIVSFLWDFETSPQDVCMALHLPESHSTQKAVVDWEAGLEAQKRAPMVRMNRPVHQPILWMFGEETSHPNYVCARRHAQSAQDWAKAQALLNYQGGDVIEPGLDPRVPNKNGNSERGFSKKTKEKQEIFIRSMFPVPISLMLCGYNGGVGAYKCSCPPEDLTHTHNPDCQCDCGTCAESRSCGCTWLKCICPPLCNCQCIYCHITSAKVIALKKQKKIDAEKLKVLGKRKRDA